MKYQDPGCAYCPPTIRACRDGEEDVRGPGWCPTKVDEEAVRVGTEKYQDPFIARFAKVASQIEAEGYYRWTRVEEIIEFAKRMEFTRLGICHCIGSIDLAYVLSGILESHGFTDRPGHEGTRWPVQSAHPTRPPHRGVQSGAARYRGAVRRGPFRRVCHQRVPQPEPPGQALRNRGQRCCGSQAQNPSNIPPDRQTARPRPDRQGQEQPPLSPHPTRRQSHVASGALPPTRLPARLRRRVKLPQLCQFLKRNCIDPAGHAMRGGRRTRGTIRRRARPP
jgi:hypothetical protein